MYDGNRAVISMIHYLKEDREQSGAIYPCTVIEYKKETEQVHLLADVDDLRDISLDADYECRIKTLQGETVCRGMIQERYENRGGKVLILQITNGFYEV